MTFWCLTLSYIIGFSSLFSLLILTILRYYKAVKTKRSSCLD